MTQEVWHAVDGFIGDRLAGEDAVLQGALKSSEAAGLPPIAVAPNQGKLLHIFASMIGARRVLEIGTLGGYSTIWLARALPEDGRVVTLEFNPRHAEVARANFGAAGLSDLIEVLVGPAMDALPQLAGGEPFDLVFIDADKENNPRYFEWAVRLARPGSLIVVDNVVRGGEIVSDSQDPALVGTRKLYDVVAADARVTATAVQTVGVKGHDGFLVARVN